MRFFCNFTFQITINSYNDLHPVLNSNNYSNDLYFHRNSKPVFNIRAKKLERAVN